MPKFTDDEKEVIYSKLRSKGELLFVAHGLKKVTVDDITDKVGIGKGTFYHFYNNKEHMFMDIYNQAQKEIFTGAEQVLTVESEGKEKAIALVKYLVQKFKEHPLVSMVSGDVYELLRCKVPKECMAQNDMDDLKLFQKAADAGIVFKYPPSVVTKATQSVFIAAHTFMDDEDEMEVVDVLIQAIVNLVVE